MLKINETTQTKINELLSRLSSAYQENAIENAIDNFISGEYTYTRQEFADECCDNYRDTLKGLDLKDIYKGFEKYGDETELQDIAYLISDLLIVDYQKKANRLIKKANKPTFWGVELNEEEIKNKRLSYGTVAKQFDAILCNDILQIDNSLIDNLESGDFVSYYINGEETDRETYEELKEKYEDEQSDLLFDDDWGKDNPRAEKLEKRYDELTELLDQFEEIEDEVFQWFLVGESALWYLKKMGELVFYSDLLGCYVWGVKHWGTSWDYVMTSLKLNDDLTSIED